MLALDLRLCAVLDPARCRDRDPAALAQAAARGGATLIQLRDKLGTDRACLRLAEQVRDALAPTGVPLVIDDRVDIALAAHVAGVHLGQDDLPVATARSLLGGEAILGATIHHPHEADALEPGLASYAGLGPVFATGSKEQRDPPVGLDGLAALVRHVRIRHPGLPLCGIAGITHETAADVIAAGVDGVAVISDIFMAEDVAAATASLRDRVDTALARRAAA